MLCQVNIFWDEKAQKEEREGVSPLPQKQAIRNPFSVLLIQGQGSLLFTTKRLLFRLVAPKKRERTPDTDDGEGNAERRFGIEQGGI
jgi:hypothetical protein